MVDSNLLVYAYDAADPAKRERAREVLDLLFTSGRGAISTQVLGEFYAAVVRKEIVPKSEAELAVLEYSRSWTVYDVTLPIVLEAMRAVRLYQFSYYDALIWATAKWNDASGILSEDGQDGQVIEGVRRHNPLLPSFDLAQLS